jgi:hypothetical protein
MVPSDAGHVQRRIPGQSGVEGGVDLERDGAALPAQEIGDLFDGVARARHLVLADDGHVAEVQGGGGRGGVHPWEGGRSHAGITA